ncbi:Enoyl-CoA hydratase / 3,2-trans-enoyl-CoA isomerase / 3-hydroxyacyl-CoA dehydrogenase [plant metagenome]|uniref:Enoyl-CoA hydratase / 3,2-trans-enoyl-CoA isomerase / 3-hydroxyacyl-CoA dehydrogenase n=1 Tax=plant metagenome TaxID=1297885 RepID=A0A484TV03_9ZZZZ
MSTHPSSSDQPAMSVSVRKVAVLGAGVMGAQIAAHCVNAGVPVLLYDLPAKDGDKSGIARQAIARLQKLKPAPLAAPDLAVRITPANYDEHLDLLADCDLVIEAIAERLDWKRDLYEKIVPALGSHVILASNTSGLSITELSKVLPAGLRPRFCGVHFFNPPRYMHLVELIPTAETESGLLDQLETFLVSALGKGVVRARDTPNFVGNRIGVFGILAADIEARKYGLSYEVVDELTGKRLGRAKSGTYRTADVVGLDTLAHVIETLQTGLPDDPFKSSFAMPAALKKLLEKEALGQKAGAGFYRKEGKAILRWDNGAGKYVPADGQIDPDVAEILAQRDPGARLKALRESDKPQARYVWALLRDTFHYAAVHLAQIANSARDVDLAMRWGFGHEQGPFEIWQAAGWRQVAGWIADDIEAGEALSSQALPEWVTKGPVPETGGVHTPKGSWNPRLGRFEPRSTLPVYTRQIVPVRLAGELNRSSTMVSAAGGRVVLENDAIRLWTLPAPHPTDVLVVSFKTKMHTISPEVTRSLLQALDLAESNFRGLVIWQDSHPFSAGADLKSMVAAYKEGGPDAIEPEERRLQELTQRLRYARVPTVAALAGLALGGGCELAIHCASRVAHLETYIGLVEVGAGLVPGAGGMAYSARRAAEQQALCAPGAPLLLFLQKFAEAIAGAKVAGSAREAVTLGYLRDDDPIVMNEHELLYVAVRQAHMLAEAGWRAPVPAPFPVAGRDGIATLTAQLVNMREGGYISDHDFLLGRHVAEILCGGDVDPGTLVDEAWILALERKAFLALPAVEATQARIASLMTTGKPLRN